jgi:hypothetical protein
MACEPQRPDASVPAVEICSDRSAPGITCSATDTE